MAVIILVIGGLLMLAFGLILSALISGIRIWRQSTAEDGPRRTTLRWLAINLIEPAVNSLLIIGMIMLFGSGLYRWYNGVGPRRIVWLFIQTWPMVVLVLPIFWAASRDAICARINLRLALWGALRWAVTVATFIMPLVLPIGVLVLWLSMRWVRQQARYTIGPRFQAIGLGAEGVMVAPPEIWDRQPDLKM